MNLKHLAAGALALTVVSVSSVAQAQPQTAVTARTTNLRAGPATDYPVVAVLPAGFALSVQGCLPEYTWCDVIAGNSRGWMSAGNINYYYQNSYVPLNSYGAAIGIGALGFVLGDYWGSHYRDRPFYRDRGRWEGRHFDHRHFDNRRFDDRRFDNRRFDDRHFVEPAPRRVPSERPDFIGRGREHRGDHRGDQNASRRDYVTRPGEVAPRAEQPPSGRPNPGVTREEQRQLNQGGSSSVDPRLKPSY